MNRRTLHLKLAEIEALLEAADPQEEQKDGQREATRQPSHGASDILSKLADIESALEDVQELESRDDVVMDGVGSGDGDGDGETDAEDMERRSRRKEREEQERREEEAMRKALEQKTWELEAKKRELEERKRNERKAEKKRKEEEEEKKRNEDAEMKRRDFEEMQRNEEAERKRREAAAAAAAEEEKKAEEEEEAKIRAEEKEGSRKELLPDIEAAAEERERVAEAKRETERRRVGIHSHLLEAQQTAARRREELEEAKRSDAANRQRMHLDLMQAHQDAAERKQQEQIAQELHSTRQNTVLEQIRTQWLLRASETKSSINVRKMKAERRQEMAESLSTPQSIQPSSVSASSSSSSDHPTSCGLTRGESFREKRQVFEQPIFDPSSSNSPSSSSNSPSSSVLNPEHVRPVGQAARRLPTNRRTQQPQQPRTVGVAEKEKKNSSSVLEAAIREGKERQLEESRAEDARRKEMAAVASAMPVSLISDLTGKLCAANNSPNLHRSTGEKGEAHRPRVIRCVGKPRVFAVEVQVSRSSLSPWSTYLFDSSPQTIFVWSGPRSSRLEQAKGMALAIIIRDHERAAKASIVKLDRFSSAEELAPFWQALECNAAQQQEAIDEQLRPEDEAVSSASAFFNGLFRLFQLSVQEPRFSEVPHPRGLMMAMLQPAHSYLLDAGTELYLWQGANSSLSLPAASDLASAFQNQRSPALPSWVRLRKVSDGGEPFLFREKFADWPDLSHSEVLKRRMHRASPLQQRSPVAGTPPAVRFDGKQLAEEVDVAAAAPFLEEERTHPPPSNGNGEVLNVWKVLGKGLKAEVLASLYGIFDSQSSFIIVYKYLVGLADRYTVFLWQGRSASRLISGSGSISMTQVYDELRQVHFVSQEVIHDCDYHLHFSSIFKHRYVVFRTPFQESPASPRLLHVRASPNHLRHDPAFIPSSAFALETDPSAASLSTNDAFILIASGTINVWIGNACHPVLREAAVAIASRLPQALSSTLLSGPNVFSENQTPLSFWTTLGGRDLYTASQPAQGFPALFAFSGHTRTFRPHLVRNFSQNDLQPDKAVFLHSGPDLFLWHGAQTPISDTRAAVAIVQEYADACCARADSHLTVTQLHDGSEPVAFTRHFHGWNATKSSSPSRVQPLLISRSLDASPPKQVSSSRHSTAVVSSPPTSAAAAEHTSRDPLAALRARKALFSSSSSVSSTPSPVVATDPLAALRARKAVVAPGDATPAPAVVPTVVVTSQSADPPKVSSPTSALPEAEQNREEQPTPPRESAVKVSSIASRWNSPRQEEPRDQHAAWKASRQAASPQRASPQASPQAVSSASEDPLAALRARRAGVSKPTGAPAPDQPSWVGSDPLAVLRARREAAATQAAAPAAAAVATPSPAPQTAATPGASNCSRCGCPPKGSGKFCFNCGNRL